MPTNGQGPANPSPAPSGRQPGPPPERPYKPRWRRRRALRGLGLCLGLVLIAALGWWLAGVIEGIADNRSPISSIAEPAYSTAKPAAPQSEGEAELPPVAPPDNSSWNFVGTAVPADQHPAPIAPDKRMLALPENGRVQHAYFDNVVFVGDSLTQGLQIWGQLENAKFCAYKGISPKQIYDGSLQQPLRGEREVPIDAIVAHQPDNVYVLLGTNAMVGMSNDALLAYYSEMLDVMRERLPAEVGIYVQSITPVLQGVDRRFHFEDFVYLNDELAKMAWEKGLYFLDLHEALAGDDGWLRTDYGARDGYHMQPAGYTAWVEYLVTHTAYSPRHAHLYEADPVPFQQAALAE